MKHVIRSLVVLVVSFGIVFGLGAALANGNGSAAIAGDSGSGLGSQSVPSHGGAEFVPIPVATVGSGSAVATPSTTLHDPIAQPLAAFDDVKAARKLGWPAAIFVSLTLLARLLGGIGKKFPSVKRLAWFGTGRVAVVIGAVGALGAAGIDAIATGGSLVAVLVGAVMAGATYYNSHAGDA